MSDETIFINRELSWLDFNRRVLALGKDKNVPLAEQVKFLAIYGSNLDEFFMVRVGSLQERANLEQSKSKKEKRENKTNMTAAEQLAAIMPKTAQLQADCDKYYAKALEELAGCGYRKVDFDHLSKEDERFWKKYFQTELFPILSPQIVDSRHPFPFLRNKEIYLGVLLREKHPNAQSLGIIPISSQMERLHFVKKNGETQFALVEELVLHYASSIFGKESILESCLFRVTRNADIDVKEGMMDHDIDYREIMTELLKRRRKLAAVRLQVTPEAAPEVQRLLCSRLELSGKRVFVQKSPLDLSFFYKLTGRIEAEDHPGLFYPAARPMLPPPDYDLTEEVQKHDVLLSYPYQSIRPFIDMLKKAARDPDVISIKMTLYRMARESQIVQALMEAAENGKEVVALVELLSLAVLGPCALLAVRLQPGKDNLVGMDPNLALFAAGFLLYAVFNAVFLTSFYRSGYKVGVAFIKALIPVTLLMIVCEALPHFPGLGWLDDLNAATQLRLLPALAVSIVVYGLGLLLTFRKAAALYEKVDL